MMASSVVELRRRRPGCGHQHDNHEILADILGAEDYDGAAESLEIIQSIVEAGLVLNQEVEGGVAIMVLERRKEGPDEARDTRTN